MRKNESAKERKRESYRDVPGAGRELRIELPDPVQVECFRRMTPGERVAAGFRMADFARRILQSHVRGLHPHWTVDQIDAAVAKRFIGNAG